MFKKIFILGAGAIGSILGSLLSEQNDVTLIGNKPHVDAINSNGLSVSGNITGNFRVPADIKIRKIPEKTLIFLTTKAHDSEKAVKKVRRLLKKDTVILVLQNGLGNEEIVKQTVEGNAQVLRGITTMAAELFKPGEVRYWKGKTTIANDSPAEAIAEILNASMLKTSISGDIRQEVWSKMVVNTVVNPLSAIFHVRNHEIGSQLLSNVRHNIVRECVAVGTAEGIIFPRHLEQKTERNILAYTNFSSMYQDLAKRKKTEIGFLNGKIVELGQKNHIATPMNEILVSFIKFLEDSNGLSREN